MVEVRRATAGQQHSEAIEAILRIAEATKLAGRSPVDEATLLRLSNHGLADSDLWLAEGGFALLQHGADHSSLDLAVAPAERRHGIGRALLDRALAAGPQRLTAWSHDDHPGAAALAKATGFNRVRELAVMRRPLTAGDSGRRPDPRIRAFRDSDIGELLRVNAAAFAWHPEQGSMDATGLAERMALPWFDPEGLLVATAGDRLLGFHWTKVHANGEGEVYVIAVDPSSQGSGIGLALTDAGLAHLAQRHCKAVHLYVEATNEPAVALYRRLGFGTDHTHVQYALP